MSRKSIPNKTTEKTTPANEEIPCSWPDCYRIFFSLKNLEQHFHVHTEGVHECIYCNRQFQKRNDLHRHIRIHTGEKPYTCSFCRKSFSRLHHLQRHLRIHTGEKPYNCKICQKSFAFSNNLVDHQRIHNGDKPYNCDICGKSFSQSSSLSVHHRIHNGDQPYRCTSCSKLFSHLSSLRGHISIHAGERFNCQIWLKSFSWKSSLQSHIRTHTDKLSPALSNGRKRNLSNKNQRTRQGENSEEQNKPNDCKQHVKRMRKEDVRTSNGVPMGVRTTRMQTEYKKQNKQLSSLTCQVCHQVSPSLQNLCRHYSLQHNSPKVVMQNLVMHS